MQTQGRIPCMDGLRALSICLVVIFHSLTNLGAKGFPSFWFPFGGAAGVSLFFVISGYLITTIIVDEMDKDRFSIMDFYERRARRILPALFLVMLCTLPFAWLWMLPQDFKQF